VAQEQVRLDLLQQVGLLEGLDVGDVDGVVGLGGGGQLLVLLVGEGVVVADVAEGSLAANFGVQKGDVVLEVNGEKIAATRDLDSASAQRARAWDLTISRGGEVIRSRIGG